MAIKLTLEIRIEDELTEDELEDMDCDLEDYVREILNEDGLDDCLLDEDNYKILDVDIVK